jgi:hypothetical protein
MTDGEDLLRHVVSFISTLIDAAPTGHLHAGQPEDHVSLRGELPAPNGRFIIITSIITHYVEKKTTEIR